MSTATDVLMFVEDPGAAGYVDGLPPILTGRGMAVSLLATGQALAYLREHAVEPVAIDGASAADLFDLHQPRLLVVGTSENLDSLAHDLVGEARARGVPSIGVIDGPTHVSRRFRGRSDDPLAHSPDELIVPDDSTRREFVAFGFPQQAIHVCGHPGYERVLSMRTQLFAEERLAIRRQVLPKAPDGRPVFVFVSEPPGGMEGHQFRRSPDYTLSGRGSNDGRTQIVVEELLDALHVLKERPYLILRLHPKETREHLADYLSEFNEVSEGGSFLRAIYTADLVIGMTSMLLTEAALLGRPTLSILPRSWERFWLPTIEVGVTRCAASRQGLRLQLAAWPWEEPRADLRRVFPGHCLERVVGVLEKRLSS